MEYEEVISAWNAQADDANSWDALGEDEKIDFTTALGREACAAEIRKLRELCREAYHALSCGEDGEEFDRTHALCGKLSLEFVMTPIA
jgi:hypothetical protein